ncbi:hypothetical protein PsorP6_005470 [Peronosclerospora sorghi]|uniref:Uncharacterized protein n=1 Tax=Peronosclerospora sorghi TaxID=230839 RepID=A0ACC0W1K8_9STRA|nr:hypothetical protein PsorP6_005470 [Peronosclerospora sorghi]
MVREHEPLDQEIQCYVDECRCDPNAREVAHEGEREQVLVPLENVLDVALSAVSEGALLGHARRGGDVASLYDRLVQTLEEWLLGRVTQVASDLVSERFGARCAVVS